MYDEITRKLQEFQSLSCTEQQGDPIEVAKLKIRVGEIDQEIGILIDRMISASATTMEYINKRIEALDEEKRSVTERLSQLSVTLPNRKKMGMITNYMDHWDEHDINDKITVVNSLFSAIHVDQENAEISWKI